MKRNLLNGCLLAVICAGTAHAQQSNAIDLDSVVVHENRIQTLYGNQNRNIQIIDSKQIQALPVKSTIELLSYIAGVDLQQRGPWGAQADVSIQGSTFDEVLVLIDGVKMNDPQTGHNMLNLPLPLSSIDHIEVVYGPASRVYGIDALAGAINIITKIPAHNEVDAQIYSGSSFKQDTSTGKTYIGWGAQASAAIAGKDQSHTISIGHDESNGYRYNTGFNDTRLFYQDHFILSSKSSIEAMAGYAYDHYGANGFYAAPTDVNSVETVQTAIGSIAYTYHPNKRFTITPRISYRYGKDDYIFVKQDPSLYENVHETNVVTGEVQSTYQFSHGTLGAGIELRTEEINSTNLGYHHRDDLGIYAEYKHYFSDKFNASAGLYGNYNSDYDFEVFPSADLGYRFVPHWKLFANASTGERLPTYTDLYYVSPANIGNANLQPEHTSYAEGGLQYDESLFNASLSYFYKHTTNFIDWEKVNLTDPWQPVNDPAVNTPGIDARFSYQLGRALRLPTAYDLVLNGSYMYLDQTIQPSEGRLSEYTIQALRHQLVMSLRSILFHHLQFDFNARYQQRISANDYTLLDARIGYIFKQWDIYADVNNILDTQYREIGTVPLPGRWFTLGVKFNALWK